MRKLTLVLVITALSTFAFARKDRPAGDEIGKKAKAAKLDSARAVTAKGKNGKTIKFTPSQKSGKQKHAEMENGHLIGVIDSQAPLTAKRLPAGTYNVYGAKVGDKWTAYFEQGGKIAGMAKLEVTKQTARKDPGFKTKKSKVKGKGQGQGKGNKKSSDFGGEQPEPVDVVPVEDDEVAWMDADCWEEEDGWWCEIIEDVVCWEDGYCEPWSDQ